MHLVLNYNYIYSCVVFVSLKDALFSPLIIGNQSTRWFKERESEGLSERERGGEGGDD